VAYNIPVALRLEGPLDLGALARSLNEIIRRHQVLRVSCHTVEGRPEQRLSPMATAAIPVADLSGLAEIEKEQALMRAVNEEARRPFDLAVTPMLRAGLLRLGAQDHVLLLTTHHYVSDGWSLRVLLRELGALYTAFRNGDESVLTEPALQYSDFARWQRRCLSGKLFDDQLAYWRNQLEGAPGTLNLPTDRPRPASPSTRGAAQSFQLPASLSEAVRVLARRRHVTLFTVLLAVFQTLLHRYSQQEDIIVGTAISSRNQQELEALIGNFSNNLPLRTSFVGNPTFPELLARVWESVLGAHANQDYPFEKLVHQLHPERSRDGMPFLQTTFILHGAHATAGLEFPGLEVSEVAADKAATHFDLTLSVFDGAENLAGKVEYSTDLFESGTIARILGHWQTLLEGIATDPDRPISALPMLTARERRQVLVDWNSAEKPYPPDRCIHEIFQAQAERTPETVAVVFEGESLTYRELSRRANRLARHLQLLGVGPEVLVGLCAERSLDTIVGMLGILKAGGAYVPLDPSYPRERHRFMLEDAQVRALLVQEKLAERFSGETVPVIALESAGRDFPDDSPPAEAAAGNLAYVMYTSGSTGKPKGVQIEHRNVVAFLHSFQPFAVEGERRIGTNVAPFCFDTSVEEIFGNLCFGGTVHIIRPEHSADARYFARYLVEHGINFSYMVPDVLERVFGELATLRDRLKLRCLVTGLAPKRQSVLQSCRDLSGSLRILNAYGPTEVTYGATVFEFQAASEPNREVPIGKPFANYRAYIVDGKLQPVPIGVAGELLIGGVGVARGYLDRPELTAEKFIPDPFRSEPGARVYRSGDLARFLPDGNIEFLGRIDSQVKIRGFRIEPGEIEAALAQHAGVERAAVAALESPAGDKRLAAYVVPKRTQDVSAGDLRNFLRDQLPDHMIPSAFSLLESLPLMVSGKIDRKALPEPDWTSLRQDEASLAPRNDLEARLVEIWQKVLGVGPVGVRDNFFDLGGHSLLAVSLFAEMEKAFGKHLPLATLFFQAPTVEQLAQALRSEGWAPRWSSLVPIQPLGSSPPFFCVHAADGEVFFYRDLARHLGTDQPFYGLQAIGMDGREPPLTTVEEMASRYLQGIRTVQPQGPYFLGGSCLGAFVALEIAQKLQTQGEELALLASFNADARWRNVSSLREGIRFHLRNLSGLRFEEILRYARRRIRYRVVRARNTIVEIICKVLLRLGRSLPVGLLRVHVQELSHRAGIKYAPQLYRGKLTYFQGSADAAYEDPKAFWDEIVTEGVEVQTVAGQNADMLREPNVRVLAEKLRACLERARTAARRPKQDKPKD
jgi:aspartate racemase